MARLSAASARSTPSRPAAGTLTRLTIDRLDEARPTRSCPSPARWRANRCTSSRLKGELCRRSGPFRRGVGLGRRQCGGRASVGQVGQLEAQARVSAPRAAPPPWGIARTPARAAACASTRVHPSARLGHRGSVSSEKTSWPATSATGRRTRRQLCRAIRAARAREGDEQFGSGQGLQRPRVEQPPRRGLSRRNWATRSTPQIVVWWRWWTAFFLAGNVVYINHGDGLVTGYFHMSQPEVAVGDTVEKRAGDRAGRRDGARDGPHLHWSARFGALTIDPADLLALGPPFVSTGRVRRGSPVG